MGSIADDMARQTIGTSMTQEVNNIQSQVNTLYNMVHKNTQRITTTANSFVRTPNITTSISEFKNNSDDYVLKYSESYNDGSNILSGLDHLMTNVVCLRTNQTLLDRLGIPNWEDIRNMNRVPSSFLDWIGLTAMQATIDYIYRTYTNPEFLMGTLFGILNQNITSFDLVTLLRTLRELVDCLYELGIDMGQTQTSINQTLDKIYISSVGSINYSKLSTKLATADIENVQSINKGTQVILNNTMNDIAKVTDSFKVPRFSLDLST